ncbi:ABC transporter G family member 25 [Colletotrichum siamense]|nr:ABC transporter G family member 25 [Colletotrichum siamense]
MSRDFLSLGAAGHLPQDPYLPQVDPEGPSFLDTAACLCALRTTGDSNSDAAWHCIGNQTQGVYTTNSGKWFPTVNGGSAVDGKVDDLSNGPDTNKPMRLNSGSLTDLTNDGGLSVYDQACTGTNRPSFSATFYAAWSEIQSNQQPKSAAPCYRPDGQAVPIRIVEADDWNANGCAPGFLCENNTVNSLPQYCPPANPCQMARLASMTCMVNGQNFPMGPFEPVVCQQGYYCPPPGVEKIQCPKGTYCQPGATSPTPCLTGSRCEAGATYELFLVPLVVLILVDVLVIMGIIVHALRKRVKDYRSDHASNMKRPSISGVKAQITGYKALQHDTDHEMLPMSATYTPHRSDTHGTGFQAALDYDHHQWTAGAQPKEEVNPQLLKFVESMRRATDATNLGLSFSYTDLSFQPKKSKKMILQNVTGSIDRGTLTAVMGGSGAGKSTFVNVLMGKTKHTGGMVAVNNSPDKLKRYKKLIGYVPQDDIVLPELTVYENIIHSAKIRLPRTWSTEDIEAHVTSVIDCLELSHVRNSLVGTVGRPVISGGQRKRVSIGMELASAPMAIFLDEPTSGLDATAASSLMRTLKAVARLGISIIVIIHQPRSEIFQLFDNLILLGNGQTIYEGPQAEVQNYFQNIGFDFPEHSNHGDVVTDIITGNGRIYKHIGEISKDSLISNWASHHQMNRQGGKEHHTSTMMNNSGMHEAIKHRGAPFFKQLWLCLRRAMVQQYRAKSAFWAEMGLAALAGFLLGLAEHSKKGILFVGTFQGPYSILSTAVDIKSAPELALLVAIAIGLVSGAPGVKSFSEELLVHRREAEAGHNRLAYFLAKLISVVPRMFFGCLHFSTFVLLLTVPVINWGLAFLANFLYFYCIYGLANIVSMVVRREDAPLLATMISLITAILSGAAPPLAKVKDWKLEWLWRASPGVWLAEVYFGQLVSPFADIFDVDKAADATGFHLHWLWRNMGTLVAIGTIYRIIAFLGLWALGHRQRS